MPATLITSRIAAHTGTRQIEMLTLADSIGDRADAHVRTAWQQLIHVLDALGRDKPAKVSAAALNRIRAAFEPLAGQIHQAIETGFQNLAAAAYDSTTTILARELPAKWLPAVAATAGPVAESRLRESRLLLEDGFEAGRGGAPLASILNAGSLPPDQKTSLYKQLLFPPAERPAVNRVVYSGNWQQRVAALSKLASPDTMAETVAAGWAAGKTPQQIARDLRPAVNNVRSSARRIARTQGMDIANGMQLHGYEKLGPMLQGFMIHATLDQHTRPWHAARSGTIYYKEPKAGQVGLDAMPHPPREADGSFAFNCRCWLSPVLRAPESLSGPGGMTTLRAAASKADLQPDQAVYTQWYTQASERERKMAIGAKRYNTAAAVLKRPPNWEDVIDPDTGNLLTIDRLKSETDEERFQRLGAMLTLLADREQQIRNELAYGFQPPKPALAEPPQTPPHFRGLVVAHPDVPALAVEKVAAILNTVSPENAQRLRAGGHRVAVVPSVRDIYSQAETTHARGYSQERSLAFARGVFDPLTRTATVAHTYRNPVTNQMASQDRHAAVVMHELGHAMDDAMGKARNSSAFVSAYAADLLLQYQRSVAPEPYFLQPGEAGRSETFAEMFQHLHDLAATGGRNTSSVDFHRLFPAVAALMQQLLGLGAPGTSP